MIELKDLCREYGGPENRVRALKHIRLQVPQGGFLAIMGPSGSGKSTLMNILGCLDDPTSGEYWLDGREVSRLSSDEKAEVRSGRIGFVFQSFHLLPRLTARENIELPMLYKGVPASLRKSRCEDLLRLAGLAERGSHLPSQLSGGQCQRIAIARALANGPALLLADEPTGNLDSKTSGEIMSLLRRLNDEGTTIVLITHDRETADWARTRACLRDGELWEEEVCR